MKRVEERLRDFFVSFYSVYKRDFRKFIDLFLRAYERDVRGLGSIDRSLLEDLAEVVAALRSASRSTLHEMKAFIMSVRPRYRYAYLVDGLGLPELYALWHKAASRGLVPELKVYINAEASTEAFKREFGAETMAGVASQSDGFVVRRLDVKLHEELGKPKALEELKSEILKRMEYVAASLPIDGGDAIVFTDHGYDVFRANSVYYAAHTRKEGAAFSKLASVLLFKSAH